MKLLAALVIVTATLLGAGSQVPIAAAEPETKTPLKHVIVLMQENHSFDNYFGTFAGVNGLQPGICMPVVAGRDGACVEPFHIGSNEIQQSDLDHSRATYEGQFNSGKMDGFVHALNQRNQDGRLAMGFYDDRDIPFYWNIASEYVLFDNFFSSVGAGSFINHVYWVAGGTGVKVDSVPSGGLKVKTIFDDLQERGITWKFYVQNFDKGLNYRTLANYPRNRAAQVIWNPLLAIDRFIDDPTFASRIVGLEEYYKDLEAGTLPSVAYIVPSGPSEHPPSSLQSGQIFSRSLVNALVRSSAWKDSAFFITYDDWGGWFDHVLPPRVDEFGFGPRVPTMLISPYARRGKVDSTQLDFTAFLKLIQDNWGLASLTSRDANSQSLLNAFDFESPGRPAEFPRFKAREPEKTTVRTWVVYLVYTPGIAVGLLFLLWPARPWKRDR
jgi:phospholipase C